MHGNLRHEKTPLSVSDGTQSSLKENCQTKMTSLKHTDEAHSEKVPSRSRMTEPLKSSVVEERPSVGGGQFKSSTSHWIVKAMDRDAETYAVGETKNWMEG
ncbi:hypothetical protein SDJN03_10254, partial [Cucurbita argyrosperma subsp. sororia]